jgi:hypothetical protein
MNCRPPCWLKRGNVPRADEENNRKAYQTYNILVWLQKSSPDCLLVKEELNRITTAHPEFRPRQHPDLDVVIGPVTNVDFQSPTTVEEMLSKTPEEQMSFLLSFEENSFIGPNRSGLLSTAQAATARSFEWGKNLAEALETRVLWDSDLWRSVVDGWNLRDLSDSEWSETLHYLRDKEQILRAIGSQVAVFLENGIKKPKNAIPDNCLLLAFEVSGKLWTALTSEPQEKREKSEDWLQLAINDPSGILAEFWLHLISRLRMQSGDSWKDIPVQCKLLFEPILRDDLNAGAELARVVFASHFHFFFSSDQAWAQQNILPLLDISKNPRRAIQCWHGYLCWGRWSDDLLPSLLPLYEKLYATIGSEAEDTQRRFCEHLAAIACFGSINPVQNGWLKRFLQSVGPKQRKEWAGDVRMMLKQMKETAKRKAWDSWMREYWQSRIDGKPMPLSAVEAGEMAEWSLHLEPVFPEAVEKICGGPSMELQHSFLYYELADTALPEQHPHSVARLLLFLLQKSTAEIYDFDRIDRVFEKIATSNVDTRILLRICNELAKLGYAGASRLRGLIRKGTD